MNLMAVCIIHIKLHLNSEVISLVESLCHGRISTLRISRYEHIREFLQTNVSLTTRHLLLAVLCWGPPCRAPGQVCVGQCRSPASASYSLEAARVCVATATA